MKISNFRIVDEGDRVRASALIESEHYGREELWFSLPGRFRDRICETQFDGFFIGMLYPAMRFREDIFVEGCLSEKLLFNVRNYVIPLLLDYSDSLKSIEVSSRETSVARHGGAGVGTGFSGGIDSFCTLYDRYVIETSPSYRVNSLLFFNVGSNGDWLQYGSTEFTKRKFSTRFHELKKFVDEVGLEFVDVDSNLHFFHDWWHEYSHSLKAAAAMLLLQKHYSKYYYSSAGLDYAGTFTYSEYYRNKAIGAYCDPILLPLLSTESLDLIPDGHAYTRSEKLLHILDYEPVTRYLNVCADHVDTWENCSVCEKCLRTLWALDITGNLDKVGNIFDLGKYHTRKQAYLLAQVLKAEKEPFAADNMNLAKSRGVKLPSMGYAKFRRRLDDAIRFPRRISRKLISLMGF